MSQILKKTDLFHFHCFYFDKYPFHETNEILVSCLTGWKLIQKFPGYFHYIERLFGI